MAIPSLRRSSITPSRLWAKAQGWSTNRTFASLHYRDYRLLWLATLGTSLGFWMQQVVLGWLILQLSGSPFVLGLASAARIAPFFFLGLVAGAVADRMDRRRLLQILIAVQTALSLTMGLLIAFDLITVVQAILLGMLYGSANAFLLTVRQAYIYDVVGPEELLNGIAMNQVAWRIMGVPGALFGGGLIAWLGMAGAFFIMGAGYAAATILVLLLKSSSRSETQQGATVWRNFLGGLRLIRENRTVMVLLALAAATEVLAFSHMSILPIFAEDVLQVGEVGLGAMMSARALGSLLGVMGLVALGETRRKGLLLLACSAGFGLSLVIFAASPLFLLALTALLVAGIASAGFDTLQQASLQLNVEEGQRGRAMGVWVLGVGIGPLGHLQVGALAEAASAPTALLVNGGLLAVIILGVTLMSPRLRRV